MGALATIQGLRSDLHSVWSSVVRSRVELFLEAASEHCSKKSRGRAKKSLELIEEMAAICAAAQPITGRGVGYKLFTAGLIPSMGRADMQRVYRLLKEAREQNIIPWEWIVDESRELEQNSARFHA